MRAKILEYVPDLLAKSMIEQKIGILKISAHLSDFSQIIQEKLYAHFAEFGLTLDNFSFSNINAPDEDLAAINEMKIQRKRDQLEAEGSAAKMDIESAARARMREREGYTYQQEQSFQVMQSAASNEGTAATLMGAGMGLGMGFGVGGAVGTGMSAIAQNTIGSMQAVPANSQQASTANNQQTTVCSACQTANPASAKFCIHCGQTLINEKRCPECGSVIVDGAKFCLNCGKKLSQVCAHCGKELVSGAKFCLECGNPV